jgi:DNA-binding MarR family transcriptional regulator
MNTTHYNTLNKQQLQVLRALYKFRFGTEELLAKYQNSNRRYMHERVRILCEQGYIKRRYDSSYKLVGKPATYHLLPKGIDILKQQPESLIYSVLRNIRKDITASNRFARHCINIFATCCKLKELYGDDCKFFTRSHLSLPKLDYFPTPKPDAYVSLKQGVGNTSKYYILECFDDTLPQSAMRKRIVALIRHADSGEWEPDGPYPELLLVCQTEALKRRVQGWAKKAVEDSWTEELAIIATTIHGLSGLIR